VFDSKTKKVARKTGPEFDQIMYMLKGHGGLMLPEKDSKGLTIKPNLAHIVASKEQKDVWRKESNHVFMFDPHGPNKDDDYDLDPAVVAPWWTLESACSLLSPEYKNSAVVKDLCNASAKELAT